MWNSYHLVVVLFIWDSTDYHSSGHKSLLVINSFLNKVAIDSLEEWWHLLMSTNHVLIQLNKIVTVCCYRSFDWLHCSSVFILKVCDFYNLLRRCCTGAADFLLRTPDFRWFFVWWYHPLYTFDSTASTFDYFLHSYILLLCVENYCCIVVVMNVFNYILLFYFIFPNSAT